MEYYDDDIRLMLCFKNGEESCFEQLVERHKQRVFNIAYRYLGNINDAEDVAQETFVKIYRAKNSYKPQAKFTTWLYTICKNTCFNVLRQKEPTLISIDQPVDPEDDAVSPQIPDKAGLSPAEEALCHEQAAIVKAAIDTLPENQKMVVILYRYDGLSYEEIAEIMDWSVQAIKSLLHRAKLNLKEKLKDYLKE